jgi:hypothetical protein
MRSKRFILAALCLFLPIALRGLWFYHGIYFGNQQAFSPAYSDLLVEQPLLSTPKVDTISTVDSKSIILFDQAHNNKYTFGELELLRKDLIWQGAEILALETKNSLGDMLTKADTFVIIAPTDPFSTDDIEKVESFVERGGRLLVIADPTRSYSEYDTEREKSVLLTNKILEPFGLSFRNDYVYNLVKYEGNYRNVFAVPKSSNLLTKNISSLVFYASHSIISKADILITGIDNTVSSLDDQGTDIPLASLDESGNVLIIGDVTFMTVPFNQVADNNQLVNNISNFLISGSRQITLADFPNLFNQPVSIRFTSGISLDKDLLKTISDLKNELEKNDLSLAILDSEETGFDQIFLGIYPPNNTLKGITDKFGIRFNTSEITPTATPSISTTPQPQIIDGNLELQENAFYIPNFGQIPSDGFGFILLERVNDHMNLYILSDSQENATKLLSRITTGSLEGCLYLSDIAVCEQDSITTPTVTPTEISVKKGTELPSSETPSPSPAQTQTATPTPIETP